jgi:hypothetical protein
VAARSARFLIEDSVQLITIELTAHFAAASDPFTLSIPLHFNRYSGEWRLGRARLLQVKTRFARANDR